MWPASNHKRRYGRLELGRGRRRSGRGTGDLQSCCGVIASTDRFRPRSLLAQAVRQVLGIDDLIPRPGVGIPALRDPVTGPKIEAAHQAILASHACRVADEAAQRMRKKLAARKPEHPPKELEELVASEWGSRSRQPARRERREFVSEISAINHRLWRAG